VYKITGISLEPLIGAVAVGNAVVLKPSKLSPTCFSLLASKLSTYLDNKTIKVIQGGQQETQQLLKQKWDKIFFTSIINIYFQYLSCMFIDVHKIGD